MGDRVSDKHIFSQLFSNNYTMAFCEELSNSSVTFADGMIVSLFIGSEAMAASGLMAPFFTAIAVIHGLVLSGTQKMCIKAHCSGDRKTAEKVYATSFFTALVLVILSTILCLSFSDQIVSFLGATEKEPMLHKTAAEYLIGLSFSIPGLVFVPLLTPIAQLIGKGSYVRISVLVITVTDILLNIICAVSGMGMFGIGLSTSISETLGLIIIAKALAGSDQISLRLTNTSLSCLKPIIKESSPKLVKRICKIIKPVTVNKVLIYMVGTAGMTAMSVRNNVSSLFECMGAALGATVFILAVIDTGERNLAAVEWLRRRTLRFSMFPISAVCALIFIFAPQIARFYIDDSAEILSLAVSAIRFMSIDLVLMSLIEILTNYWHGTGRVMATNTFIILQRLVYPLICASLFGYLFGPTGIWMSFPISSLLFILTVPFFARGGNQKFVFFPVPENCTGNNNSCQFEISDTANVEYVAESIQNYCLSHGIDSRRSMLTSLCFEEISTGILVEYGEAKSPRKTKIVSVSVTVSDGTVNLIIRDNCKDFDYKSVTLDPEHPEKHVGLRIISGIAKNIRSVNMYGMNCLSLEL